MTLPAVRCRTCRELLRYDEGRGTFHHRDGSRMFGAHISDPDPRDRNAFLRAYREQRAERAGV